jgi:hypothetical protein
MGLQKYHSDNKAMEWVQVWLDKIRVTEETRLENGIKIYTISRHFPAERIFLGECEAAPEAIAKLADVHVVYAVEALKKMGGILISIEPYESGHNEYYLVVLPAGVKRHPLL